jgi:hypothetical protein
MNKITTYFKKPLPIEAIEWDGSEETFDKGKKLLYVMSESGSIPVKLGFMILIQPDGEMYPCEKEKFLKLHEIPTTAKGIEDKSDKGHIVQKTLQNTTSDGATKNVKDIKFWGDGDTFKLISKAHSKYEGWMKSTKAMEIEGIGCVVQVTTQQGDNVAEALVFVPGTTIEEEKQTNGVVGRRIKSAITE